jgi:ADP-ribosylation factor GTPase-activating protein 1
MNFSNPEIAQIMTFENNGYCVDCLASNPTFTSVNNAVFICENCANMHRPLGPNISLVKSLINDQFSPEEIKLLKIGGNLRFNTLISEYGITNDQNKEFKYHLKIADYYRKLLLAELNKETNPNEYQMMLNSKPSPEIGLQIMESVTVESINQAQQSHSEIYKDASNLAGKISGFFNSIGNAINDTVHKYGIDEKINTAKNKINEEAKTFGENHPTIQNAANTAMEAIKTVGNAAMETATKIVNSEPVQSITHKANEKYQEVMNSETVKNLSKKAEEQYISLKAKAIEKFGNNNNPQP